MGFAFVHQQNTNDPTMKKTLFVLFAIFCILIGLYPSIYFIIEGKFGFLLTKPNELLQNLFWKIGFYTHIIFGGLALLIGWIQFVPKWRDKNLNLHRTLGKLYVIFVFLSSLASLSIVSNATGGLIPALGFGFLGVIWFLITLFAFITIRKGNVLKHQKLMIFSYAACFSAVTLRLYMPILMLIFHDFIKAYTIVAWLCWIPNLIFAFISTKNIKTSSVDVSKS